MNVLNSVIERYGVGQQFGVDPGTADLLKANINEHNGNQTAETEGACTYTLEQIGGRDDHQYVLHKHGYVAGEPVPPSYVVPGTEDVTYRLNPKPTDGTGEGGGESGKKSLLEKVKGAIGIGDEDEDK